MNRLSFLRRLIVLVTIAALCSSPGAYAHKWTDATGSHSVEADFISIADGVVKLKKSDGTTIEVPLDRLSTEDQAYAHALATGAGANRTGDQNTNAVSTKPPAVGGQSATEHHHGEIGDGIPATATEEKNHANTKRVEAATPPVDLAATLQAAGYSTTTATDIEQYVRFGVKAVATRALRDQFSRIEVERGAEAHQKEVESQTYLLRDQPIRIFWPRDFEQNGLILSCPVAMVLFSSWSENRSAGYHGSISKVSIFRAELYRPWFLTKDKSLQQCTISEAVAVERNDGYIYLPFGRSSEVLMDLGQDLQLAKSISQNVAKWKADVVIQNVRYDRPLEYGFYQRHALQDLDWDCDEVERCETGLNPEAPLFFCPDIDAERIRKVLQADLVAIRLKKDGILIGSFEDPGLTNGPAEPTQRAADPARASVKDNARPVKPMTWQDTEGTTFQAEFVLTRFDREVKGLVAVFRMKDDKTYTLPWSKLSPGSQTDIKNLAKQHHAAK